MSEAGEVQEEAAEGNWFWVLGFFFFPFWARDRTPATAVAMPGPQLLGHQGTH